MIRENELTKRQGKRETKCIERKNDTVRNGKERQGTVKQGEDEGGQGKRR